MMVLERRDTSLLGRWWWTVDRWSVAALAVLLIFGGLLALAATPPVAERLGLDSFHFAWRHLFLVPIAGSLLVGMSFLTPRGISRVAWLLFAVSLALVVLTFLIGVEVKGARRWISLGFMSLQPSEFLKPSFAIVTAAILASYRARELRHGNLYAIALYGIVAGLLLLQPDVGMTLLVTAVWFSQFFLAGLQIRWAAGFTAAGIFGMIMAYFIFPHVSSRVDRFMDPASGDSYQVDRSLDAFVNGGLIGRGPGEGTVKAVLPDAHSDFVFAVVGEEFGLVACLLLLGLFGFIVLRTLGRMIQDDNLFVILAASGLVIQFGLQAAVNMGSTLRLIPTKGMTLPFLSYGGSSLIATALAAGMLLALTRRRFGRGAL